MQLERENDSFNTAESAYTGSGNFVARLLCEAARLTGHDASPHQDERYEGGATRVAEACTFA